MSPERWQRIDQLFALPPDERAAFLIALDTALNQLEQYNERLVHVVKFRYFGGLTNEETAKVLDVSPRTVERDWKKARAWLFSRLPPDADDASAPSPEPSSPTGPTPTHTALQ